MPRPGVHARTNINPATATATAAAAAINCYHSFSNEFSNELALTGLVHIQKNIYTCQLRLLTMAKPSCYLPTESTPEITSLLPVHLDSSKRSYSACTVCRKRKTKCKGGYPGVASCRYCSQTGQVCIFTRKHRKVLIDQSALHELEIRAGVRKRMALTPSPSWLDTYMCISRLL